VAKEGQKAQSKVNTDVDRFPTMEEGLRDVLDSLTEGDLHVRRIDIRFDASGSGVYRYWPGREEEPSVGATSHP
jgi:hypothetical protein